MSNRSSALFRLIAAPLSALSSRLFKVHSSPKHPDLVCDHTQTPQHCDRCPLSTQSQRTWGLEENICSSAKEEETKDCYLGFGKQQHGRLQKRKKPRTTEEERRVSACLSAVLQRKKQHGLKKGKWKTRQND